MQKKGEAIKEKSSKVASVKVAGRKRNVARVSFSSMMPDDYTPHQRSKLKEFESSYIDDIRIYEKINVK